MYSPMFLPIDNPLIRLAQLESIIDISVNTEETLHVSSVSTLEEWESDCR